MTLRDQCLPIFEGARVYLAKCGFRRFDVVMRVIEWSGQRVGEGTKTVTDTPLLVQDQRVKVRRIEQKDIIASGGELEDIDYRIGPFTPAYANQLGLFPSGGIEPVTFNPLADATSREIYYKITGQGMENGGWFTKISQESDRSFSYYFTVRKSAVVDP